MNRSKAMLAAMRQRRKEAEYACTKCSDAYNLHIYYMRMHGWDYEYHRDADTTYDVKGKVTRGGQIPAEPCMAPRMLWHQEKGVDYHPMVHEDAKHIKYTEDTGKKRTGDKAHYKSTRDSDYKGEKSLKKEMRESVAYTERGTEVALRPTNDREESERADPLIKGSSQRLNEGYILRAILQNKYISKEAMRKRNEAAMRDNYVETKYIDEPIMNPRAASKRQASRSKKGKWDGVHKLLPTGLTEESNAKTLYMGPKQHDIIAERERRKQAVTARKLLEDKGVVNTVYVGRQRLLLGDSDEKI